MMAPTVRAILFALVVLASLHLYGQADTTSVTFPDGTRMTETCTYGEHSADCKIADTTLRQVTEWVAPTTHPEFANIADFCKGLHYGNKRSVTCKAEWDVEVDARARLAEHEQAEKDARARAAAFEAKYAIKPNK